MFLKVKPLSFFASKKPQKNHLILMVLNKEPKKEGYFTFSAYTK